MTGQAVDCPSLLTFLPRAQQMQNQSEHSTCETELLNEGKYARKQKQISYINSHPHFTPTCVRLSSRSPLKRSQTHTEQNTDGGHFKKLCISDIGWVSLCSEWSVLRRCRGGISAEATLQNYLFSNASLCLNRHSRNFEIWEEREFGVSIIAGHFCKSSVQKANWLLIGPCLQCIY